MKCKLILKVLATLAVIGVIVVVMSAWWISNRTNGLVHHAPYNNVSATRIGLLLGTAKYSKSGNNLYYSTRIEAAVKAFRARKIQKFLVSGDNSTKDYDEPSAIKLDLVLAGIPADSIVLDYAGFDTYDSMIRVRDIFGVHKAVVISQEFHCRRAIFIGQNLGMEIHGIAADDPFGKTTFWMNIRESLARTKAVMDVAFQSEPHFRGTRIQI